MTNTEAQLASFFAKYGPATTKLGKGLRAKLRKRLPGLHEIVYFYANQDALVISYSPSENGYEGVFSLRVDPREVKLFFTKGGLLAKSDPGKMLQGRGDGVRHVVLASVADFDRPEIDTLMDDALKLAKVRVTPGAKGDVIVRAEAQRKRASRASAPARKKSAVRRGNAPR